MALLAGLKNLHPSAAANRPYILGYQTARSVADDPILELWSGSTVATRVAWVNKDGHLKLVGTRPALVVGSGTRPGRFAQSVGNGSAEVLGNLSWSGSQWELDDTAALGTAIICGPAQGGIAFSRATAGANPRTLNQMMTLDAATLGAAFAGLLTANAGVTVASGQTLTLTGATVAGAPTWSASQAITLSTAAQPNITSLGSLTSLTIAAGSTTNALIVTTTGALQQSWRYDGSNRIDLGLFSGGGGKFSAVGGAGAGFVFSSADSGLVVQNDAGSAYFSLRSGDSGDAFSITHSAAADTATLAGATVITEASASGRAGFRLPHGAAPSSPVNGDIWTTTAGLFARINGATVGPYS